MILLLFAAYDQEDPGDLLEGKEVFDSPAVMAEVSSGLSSEATIRFRLYDWLICGAVAKEDFQV